MVTGQKIRRLGKETTTAEEHEDKKHSHRKAVLAMRHPSRKTKTCNCEKQKKM